MYCQSSQLIPSVKIKQEYKYITIQVVKSYTVWGVSVTPDLTLTIQNTKGKHPSDLKRTGLKIN